MKYYNKKFNEGENILKEKTLKDDESKNIEINKSKYLKYPSKGKLIVVTDLHGNLNDYKEYLAKWDSEDPDCYILFTGDLIHAYKKEDKSIEILEDVMEKSEKYDNFNVLLGNHEWSHVSNTTIQKGKTYPKEAFKDLIQIHFGTLSPLNRYINFFREMPIIAKTNNGIFISHAGPYWQIKSEESLEKIINSQNFHSKELKGFLWNRYNRVLIKNIDRFLDTVNCKAMVVGHTAVEGIRIHGNQLVLSSSFQTEKKAYLEIDLNKKIESIKDLEKMVKYL